MPISDKINIKGKVQWISIDLVDTMKMKRFLLVLLCSILSCEGAVIVKEVSNANQELNERPIIGILSQEQSFYLHGKFPEESYTSYIAASYVKDVEKAGARVVPILIGKDRSYYKELMKKLNGVLFPGGATFFNQSNGYADAAQHIYEIAQEFNDAGDYFPIFATCLGFQLMIILASGRGTVENRSSCRSFTNLPLVFASDFRSSKMFRDAPEDMIHILANENVTINYHQYCILDSNLKAYNLINDWRPTSYSYDDNHIKFIATYEHRRYPFYAVQFHPEKSSFEWKLSKHYAHSINAVKSNRVFMDFFVSECRKNTHAFEDASEENKYLIYNYPAVFTGVLGSAHHECYFFEPRGKVSK
ncbi:gamma-glutamyl hydrolase-like [Colias croceus]|uniref:gamma-glutamyl hydrolase-like n=1 Tax=Colias crocea TaxID=72248 RepID=UPI001E27FC8E|nr:gamma-glutamyl hydrolase-like [Colias croceus]